MVDSICSVLSVYVCMCGCVWPQIKTKERKTEEKNEWLIFWSKKHGNEWVHLCKIMVAVNNHKNHNKRKKPVSQTIAREKREK